MKRPTKVFYGDFAEFYCPHCGEPLTWDPDYLYDFCFESVVCNNCEGEFEVKRKITYSFEVKKPTKEN